MSFDYVAAQKAMQDWVESGSGLVDTKVYWGEQDAGRPKGPAVMLRITNIAEIGRPELNIEDNFYSFADLTITSVDTVGNTLAIANHNLETGVGPVFVDSDADDPPAPTLETKGYYVIAVDPGHVRLAATFENTGGGDIANPVTPIVLADVGSGVLKLKSSAETRHAMGLLGISRVLVRMTLELRCHGGEATGNNMAVAILQRVRLRRELDSQQEILRAVNLSLIECERVQAIMGIKDALLFLPKAQMEVHLSAAMEESEAMQLIASVEITDQSVTPNKVTLVSS